GDMTGVRHDLEILHRSDEAFLLLLEIFPVAERQPGGCPLEHLQREFRRRFALGMEMLPQRSLFLSAGRALIEDEVTGYVERGSRSGNRLDELASTCHCLLRV